jgi:hypothetical protein
VKKIPCLFQRDFTNQRNPVLLREVTPGCEWVLAGEGVATRKWDGTACMVKDGRIYARLDCKKGKVPPPGAIPCDPAPDPVTGHWPHWVEATRPEDKYHREAFAYGVYPDGTYELIGPKVNGNHEAWDKHELARHGDWVLDEVPRDFAGLRGWLESHQIEGIVFHRPDGRMAKIRRDDFGFPWPLERGSR